MYVCVVLCLVNADIGRMTSIVLHATERHLYQYIILALRHQFNSSVRLLNYAVKEIKPLSFASNKTKINSAVAKLQARV